MKKLLLVSILGIFCLTGNSQSNYLSDLIWTKYDLQFEDGYVGISFNYWRYDTCLYSKQMCKYNAATAASVRVKENNNIIAYEFLWGNTNGYPGHNQNDTLKYYFLPDNIDASQFIRKVLIKDDYRIDTFSLTSIDTLIFSKPSLIKKVFGKSEGRNQKFLKIYVLKSIDVYGSTMLHYWVERIGIVKLTDEKCWRYSFEMDDDRTKSIEKLFKGLIKLIKKKYQDPYWLSNPCGIEQ